MKIVNHIITIVSASLVLSCSSGDHETMEQLPPVTVKVSKALIGGEQEFISVSGKIEAKNSANLSTRMMGNVTRLNVAVGEVVRKGQQLITISNSDLSAKRSQVEAGISQATSALLNAEKDYKRFQSLYEKESASEKELDDMTTRYEMAKANLEAAKQMKQEVDAQFTYTNIRAPFNGVIVNTFIKEGDMANPGMPLLSIEGMQDYQSVVLVPESDISNVRGGTPAKIHAKSLNKEFDGKVVEVSPSARNTGGQYLVKIDIDEVGEGVLPGMFVNARIQLNEKNRMTDHVLVPSQALVRQGQLTGIYAVGNNQTAILRWLRTGKEYDGNVEVLSGLQSDELFIVSSEGKLFNGVKVTY